MKINVRRCVFETNSSTDHTYTFRITDKKDQTVARRVFFSTPERKAALIGWLFKETDVTDDCLYLGGFILRPNLFACADDRFDEKFRSALLSLCGGKEGTFEELAKRALAIVLKNEEKFFSMSDFSYASRLTDRGYDDIKDELSSKERTTLALKAAIFAVYFEDYDFSEKYLSAFYRICEKKIDTDTLYMEILDFFADRLMCVGKLREIYKELCVEICGKTAENIAKSIGYIGFDGLLDDSYDFGVFSSELRLDLTGYREFCNSLKQFLSDREAVVLAE